MFNTINNDDGSLKVGISAGDISFKVGDRIKLLGEAKVRTVTFVMGKGEKTHLCFKAQGKLPMGEVSYEMVGEAASTQVDDETEAA